MTAGKTTKLTRVFFFYLIVGMTLSFFLLGFLWITWEYERFNQMSEHLRSEFLSSQKEKIKRDVEKVIEYIEYKKSQTETRLKRDIRNRTDEAWHIATHLYDQNKATQSDAAIKAMIREALRPIRLTTAAGIISPWPWTA
jgi:nanoRNase/pAp phosphatase (c-di-AMP/oligoRNAs hydrolase)